MKVRTFVATALAGLGIAVFCTMGSALADGTVRVQRADGSVEVYSNVTMWVKNRHLYIRTNDKIGTLVITDAACSLGQNKILMCLPYSMELNQGGQKRELDFRRGTIYYNKSDTKQQLRWSSTQLQPNEILGLLISERGTHVTISGTLGARQ